MLGRRTNADRLNARSSGGLGRRKSMVLKLAKSAERRWRRLKGSDRLAEVVEGVRFKNGVREEPQEAAA